MSEARQRGPVGWYLAMNLGFVVFVAIAAISGAGDNPRVFYLCALFAICSYALLLARPANGPYAILIVLQAFYFLCYGAADLLALFTPIAIQTTMSIGILSLPELAVLLGALLLVLGYRAAVALTRRAPAAAVVQDWPDSALIIVGLTLWILGIMATWLWASEVVERYVVARQLGPVQVMGVTLARYAQPVGFALIAYKFVMSRGLLMSLLVLAMLATEFVFGFIADSKELAIRGGMIVLIASFFVHGKVPKTWLAVAALVIVVAVPVFQAYRYEVLQEGGQTRTQGAQDLGKNLQRALESDIVTSGSVGQARGALGRLSLKPTMELIVARVGKDVSYQNGYTISMLVGAFIPRIIWPTKPDNAVGQLFNRQFGISADPNTYISATQLGELYWNFGWSGVVLGMPLIGFMLGWVGARCSLADTKSMTRFLVLAVTVYLICLRFEGGIAITYTQWLRSVALVLLLHIVFARRSTPTSAVATTTDPQLEQAPFPNLLR